MRSPTPTSKKFSSLRNGLVTSLARLNKSALRMPTKRLAIFVLFASVCVGIFFFILLGAAGVINTTQDRATNKISLVTEPEPLVTVLKEQGALNVDHSKSKPCRVLIVTMEIGFSSPGGIGTAYTGLALALVDKGHNVTVLFVDDNRHTREEWMSILAPLDGLGLKVEYIDPMALTGCYYSCQRSYRIYSWLRAHDGQFDVIHFHDNGGLAFYSTRAKSQGLAFHNTVLCVGAHGPHMWVLEWNRETVDSLVHLEVDEMERSSVALSDVMISPSAYMPTWMQSQGWTLPGQSYVHPNILPANLELDEDHKLDSTIGGSRVPVKEFVFFGRLERRKGLWIFLDALDLIWTEDNTAFDNIIITFLGRDTVFRDPTKKNRETRASEEIERHCQARGWTCIYMLNMDHVGAIRYLRYRGIVAVMPSPMDNSPNVVSECLMYSIPFLAFSVGGIPELIRPEDRDDVLSEPDADSLSVKLMDIMKNGAYRARIGMEPAMRAQGWIDWHMAAQSSASYSPLPLPASSLSTPSITICVLYNPEKWGNNLQNVVNSLKSQEHFASQPWEILVLVKSTALEESIDLEMGSPLKMRVARHKLDESDIVSLYGFAASNAQSKYLLLLDPVSWLNTEQTRALHTLASVAERTRAHIVTAQGALNDTTSSILLHIGSVGMYSSIVNCIGDWNMLASREAFTTLLPFDRGDDIWRVYARAMMKEYVIQSIPDPLFFQSVRISRDVDHRNTLEVNREFRPLFVRPYDTLVMVTQGFIKTKRLHDVEEEGLRQEYESMAKQLEQYKAARDQTHEKFSPLTPTLRHTKFFFVRGFEKSGTTWLRDVIGLHPAVFLPRWEFHFEIMSRAVNSFTSKPWQASLEPYKNVTLQWWSDFVPALLASDIPEELHSEIQWIGEKTPGALEPVIPGAKYVTIIRDGRDVAVSLFFHYANLGGFQGFCPLGYLIVDSDVALHKANKTYFPEHPERLLALEECVRFVAKMWVERVTSDLKTTDLLNAESENSAHVVLYEDLHNSCEAEREKIYRFLDLNPGDANPLSRNGWTLPGFGDEKTNRNLFYRKGMPGDWKNYMVGKAKDWFKEEAGEMLIQLGYEENNDW